MLNGLPSCGQVAASCPIDRIQFSLIHVRVGGAEGEEGRVEKVAVRRQEAEQQEEEQEPEIQCEVCSRGDRENLLLLCDGCDLGTYMLNISGKAFLSGKLA